MGMETGTEIQRVPIVGVERQPIVSATKEMTWDALYSKFVNYIKFAAKKVAETACDTSVSAEDMFQEGQLVLYNCFTKYNDRPESEFAALFKSSLWRKLRDIASHRSFINIDIDEAYDLGYTEDTVQAIYDDYRMSQVADMLQDSPVALTIFNEFINPSRDTIWESEMDIARKEMLRAQDYKVSVPHSVRVRGTYIQRALGITKKSFNENLKIVKACVSDVYGIGLEDSEGLLELNRKCS